VLELMRGEEHVWSPRAEHVREGDVLLVRGDWSKLSALKDELGLEIDPEFTLSDRSFHAPGGDGDGRAFADRVEFQPRGAHACAGPAGVAGMAGDGDEGAGQAQALEQQRRAHAHLQVGAAG
jgi:hypothetical protein